MRKSDLGALLGADLTVGEWVRRRLGSVEHEIRVGQIARKLFQLTQRWHGLSTGDVRLLVLASLLHDVGRCEGNKKHAHRGAVMILESRSLGFSEAERRRLAYLTRHHKGEVPPAGEDQFLDARLDDPEKMHILLGLLRAADGLDSRRVGGPSRLVIAVRGRQLMIYGYVEGNAAAAAELYGRSKKFRLIEETLDCIVRTHWVGMEEMGLVG